MSYILFGCINELIECIICIPREIAETCGCYKPPKREYHTVKHEDGSSTLERGPAPETVAAWQREKDGQNQTTPVKPSGRDG